MMHIRVLPYTKIKNKRVFKTLFTLEWSTRPHKQDQNSVFKLSISFSIFYEDIYEGKVEIPQTTKTRRFI